MEDFKVKNKKDLRKAYDRAYALAMTVQTSDRGNERKYYY